MIIPLRQASIFLQLMIGVIVSFLSGPACSAEETARIVQVAPKTGHFAASTKGYMIPYSQRIPGTDVTFDMIPVPGAKGVAPFWIGKYEVTFAEYKQFMKLNEVFREFHRKNLRQAKAANQGDVVSAPTAVYDPMFRFEYAVGDGKIPDGRYPVASMTRYAARQYTKWLSLISNDQFRLPTEFEWGHACRAGKKAKWSFGDDPALADQYCVYFDNSVDDGPSVVGSKKPNAWGIHDMHGNVAEWVLQRKFVVEEPAVKILPNDEWQMEQNRAHKQMVFKGGDWTKDILDCRCSIREHASEELWQEDPGFPHSPQWLASGDSSRIGFRIVRPLNDVPRRVIEKFWSADASAVVESVKMQIEHGLGTSGIVDRELPELQHRGNPGKR